MFRSALMTSLTIAVALTAGSAAAQTDRVMIGGPPAPDQTLRVRMTQEMDVSLAPAGQGAADPSMKMTGATVMVIRQQIGKPEADGRIRLDLTYEEMTQKMLMNGQEMPVPAQLTAGITGKTVALWIDSKYQVLDVKAPEGFPLAGEQLKTMMGQMMAAVPHQQMSVGETVSTPLSMALPIPVPGSARAQLKGQTKTTLVKLSAEGDDHVATLDHTVDATLDMAPETPTGKFHMAFTLSGSGTTETMVRSGTVRSSAMTTKLDGSLEPQGGATGPGPMKLTGTIKQKIDPLP
jgi:hypothetical protein